ncbi:hypothetical protein GOBAR_AA18268 [Gossypium barbadense]|uniref:PGG domain-containing protein n=1 Tax=Gossypium barbadense TaxID=3634 RepID=A0A2P5XG98_GOSBA|nr:hypothetical protein GOBAR_AA18268 [Gossypium barbadense]
MCKEWEKDLEKGLSPRNVPAAVAQPTSPSALRRALVLSSSSKALSASNSSKTLPVSNSSKSLLGSSSGKRFDKKYVKQVTGRHNDTELHLAAQRDDVGYIRQILAEIDSQMMGTVGGAEFDAEQKLPYLPGLPNPPVTPLFGLSQGPVAEIRLAIVNEVNELGETALFIGAAKGYLDVVKELLKHTTEEGLKLKSKSGFDPLHIAANQGHEAIVQLLLDHNPELSKTVGQANATPLVSAATKGHTAVVNVLLRKDPSLLDIPKANGKIPLHFAARQGHMDIVKAFLDTDPQLARKTDKKGQTALHMAVKGVNSEVVRLLLKADSDIAMLPDKFGNTALHVATRKKRTEIVNELLELPNIDVNALSRDHKTAIDIAEGLPLSEEIAEIKENLTNCGAVRANELNRTHDELRKTVKEIKKDVHTQLEQARKTNRNVNGIAVELRKLHRMGVINATNTVTVVAVLFATVAFAAIFTVPGGDYDSGIAVAVKSTSFRMFYFFNAISLFTSLSVVVVQMTVVRGQLKSERRVIEVINKMLWVAAVCTTISFMASSYIVVGKYNEWAAVLVTVIGGIIMAGVLIAMTYYVVKSKRIIKVKKKEKSSRNKTMSNNISDSEPEVNTIYAI